MGHLDVCGGDVVPVLHQLRIFNIKSINSQVISISHIRTHKIIFFEISNTKYALISVFSYFVYFDSYHVYIFLFVFRKYCMLYVVCFKRSKIYKKNELFVTNLT